MWLTRGMLIDGGRRFVVSYPSGARVDLIDHTVRWAYRRAYCEVYGVNATDRELDDGIAFKL